MIDSIRSWFGDALRGWQTFWFRPESPHTLAMVRIATGAMLLYTHLVLALDLEAFLGPGAWVNNDLARELHDGTFGASDAGWSYLWSIESSSLLWLHQVVAIVVCGCLMVGFMTRIVAPVGWLMQLMFMHRLTGALFGLDQITTMLVMYLMLAPCGGVYSVDAWLRRKLDAGRQSPATKSGGRWIRLFPSANPSTMVRVATRLAQLHLCVIYLFGGLWKARGEMWWDGTALWFAAVNYEYQSVDLTWIARYPILFAALTHTTVFWETFYCALVWPRWSRPLVLITAVMVHGGIAIFLGMITFGVMMIVANAVFIVPSTTAAVVDAIARRSSRRGISKTLATT
jgi:hypothetical protein